MTRSRILIEEPGAERLPKWRQAPNRMRPEAIAMRRIVVEMGCWLSPFMRDEPLPVLTEWERTADLRDLMQTRYVPAEDYFGRPEKTPKKRVGASSRAKQSLTLAEIRERQNSNTSKASERRRQKRAK